MILTVTGHRPDKVFPPRYQFRESEWLEALVGFAVEEIATRGPTEVISGMARGWDLACAEAAVRLDIPFTAAVPFVGQEGRWPARDQIMYRDLLEQAARVVIVCKHSLDIAYQERNEWMVDRGDRLLALWDGSNGGTANCVRYAERVWCMTTDNVWNAWSDLCDNRQTY